MTNHFGLIILDGWGIGDKSASDAISAANTPFMDSLWHTFPHATLKTFGEDVGLPDGQMGNSEVGHLNIGAGRIVYQELTRINKSIRDGEFQKNPVLLSAFEVAKERNSKVHFIGLVSEGGVHSSQAHLHTLCDMANAYGLEKVFVHAFTDGRDCDPKSGLGFIQKLEEHLKVGSAKIASIIGRYYAMDRDKRWERVAKAYQLLTKGIGTKASSPTEAIRESYENGVTDEFIDYKGLHVVFEKDNLINTLGEVISNMDRTQVRIAETEKYPHVTFFFNGGREEPFQGESRILVNSPKVATYDLQPEMSAPEVRDRIISSITQEKPNFICLNFANPDMVGHTGVFSAITKAVETVDSCLRDVVTAGQANGYEFLIIADHGNADFAINADGTPNTAHSLNPVPVILVTEDTEAKLNDGILADVAPTILNRMRLAAPIEMTGKSLLQTNS